MLEIIMLPILEDNYCYILKSPDGPCAVLDPGDEKPVINLLENAGWSLRGVTPADALPTQISLS